MKSRTERPLPEGWAWAKLGEIGDYLNGRAFSKSEWAQTGRMIVRIQDLTGTGSKPNYFEGSVESRYEVRPGDLLVSWAATLGAYLWSGPEAVLNQHIFKVKSHINTKFHYYLLQSVLEKLKAQAHGTGMVHITKAKFDAFDVPVPPLPEQQRIVSKLENLLSYLDAAVNILERVQKKLEHYRAAVLKAACGGRLVPTEAELARAEGREYETAEVLLERILAERCKKLPKNSVKNSLHQTGLSQLPDGWNWTTFGQLLIFLKNGLATKPDADVGLPILRISAVRSMSVDLSDVRFLRYGNPQFEDAIISNGDLLFTRYNGNPELVGVCGVVRNVTHPITHPDKLIRAKVPTGLCLPDFLEIVLNTSLSREHLAQRIRTTAGQSGISGSDLRSMPVPIAPLEEQHRIVKEAHRRLSILREMEKLTNFSIRRGKTLRHSLLKVAFRGELSPQDSNEEPASILLERIREARSPASQAAGGARRGTSQSRSRRRRPEPAPLSGDSTLQNRIDVQENGAAPRVLVEAQFIAPSAATEPTLGKPLFVEQDPSSQMGLAWETLFGRGLFGKKAAVREIAQGLRKQNLAHFQRLRQDGPLFNEIAATLDRGVRQGFFDRPKRGHIRAILPDPKSYSLAHWRLCLLGALDGEPVEEEDALRAAAEWARENMGLEFVRLREDGVILQGLRAALKEAVKQGEITRRRGKVFRSATVKAV